jgi:hypothetical protein
VNTPAHVIFSAAAFARPDAPRRTVAAILGALAPDVSLYVMVSVSVFILGVPARTVFRDYYYSPEWQLVFAVDNSFILWGVALGIALWRRWTIAAIFCGSALLHLAFDFPLHNHDARMHFWPLTDWKFISPFSYWDGRHHGDLVGRIETGLCLILLLVLFRRFQDWIARVVIGLAAVAQLAPVVIWGVLF